MGNFGESSKGVYFVDPSRGSVHWLYLGNAGVERQLYRSYLGDPLLPALAIASAAAAGAVGSRAVAAIYQ